MGRDYHSFGPSPFIGHTPTTTAPLLMPTVMPETFRSDESGRNPNALTSDRVFEQVPKEETIEKKTTRSIQPQ